MNTKVIYLPVVTSDLLANTSLLKHKYSPHVVLIPFTE